MPPESPGCTKWDRGAPRSYDREKEKKPQLYSRTDDADGGDRDDACFADQ